MLTTKITRALGGNSDLLTSQSFVFQGATAESEQVMLIVLISAEGDDVFSKIRNIGLSAEQHFFSSDVTITQRLQETVNFLQDQITDLKQCSILLATLKDEVLYMISRGADEVLLLRDSKTTHLVKAAENQLISGYLQPEDRVLFLSARFSPTPLIPQTNFEAAPTNGEEGEGEDPQIGTESPEIPPATKKWEEYFIQRLLLSDQEIIEEEIESYLANLPQPEPIAVVLLSTQTHQGLEEPDLTPTQYSQPQKEEPVYPEPTRYAPHQTPTQSLFPKRSFSPPKIPLLRIRRSLYRLIFPLTFKKIGIIAAVLLILIGTASFQIYQLGKNKLVNQQFSQAVSESKNNLNQAQMNRETNPQMAKQYLSQAKQSFEQANKIKQNDPQLEELNKELNSAQQAIFKSTPLIDWQTFLSLDLIKPNFSAERMSLSLKRILLLDKAQKSLVFVDIDTKNNQLIGGQTQIGNATVASINGDYIFSYSEDKGVIRYDLNTKKPLTVAAPDKEWGRISDVFSFSSNVYLLDSGNNQIWKYVPTQDSYAEKQIYLRDNQGLDFSTAKQLFIDFSVWVVKENAELYRFTSGNKDFFSIGGLDQPLTEIKSLYAPEEEDKVFLLDPSNKRIVVTKKNGEFILQYTSDKFAAATDLVYEESTKTLYLLEAGKIWQTTLQ